MKSLNRRETTKLFYDEYPYKLVVVNGLAFSFREKNLANAKADLDLLQQQYDQGEPLVRGSFGYSRPVDYDTFFEAKNLYIEFCKQDDFKLRVSNPYMQIYSHDYNWLVMLSTKIKSACEFWEPKEGNLSALEKNVILVNSPVEYQYKVTLGHTCDKNLASWIKNNTDKVKAGNICLDTIENSGYVRGMYFYVRDEKILQLLNLFVSKLARIDKLVYNTNIDK
jgi:hypothetical protein